MQDIWGNFGFALSITICKIFMVKIYLTLIFRMGEGQM